GVPMLSISLIGPSIRSIESTIGMGSSAISASISSTFPVSTSSTTSSTVVPAISVPLLITIVSIIKIVSPVAKLSINSTQMVIRNTSMNSLIFLSFHAINIVGRSLHNCFPILSGKHGSYFSLKLELRKLQRLYVHMSAFGPLGQECIGLDGLNRFFSSSDGDVGDLVEG